MNGTGEPREYDFRITRMRVSGRLAWVVEIRGLDISVHHWDSYNAAVRLAEIAVCGA